MHIFEVEILRDKTDDFDSFSAFSANLLCIKVSPLSSGVKYTGIGTFVDNNFASNRRHFCVSIEYDTIQLKDKRKKALTILYSTIPKECQHTLHRLIYTSHTHVTERNESPGGVDSSCVHCTALKRKKNIIITALSNPQAMSQDDVLTILALTLLTMGRRSSASPQHLNPVYTALGLRTIERRGESIQQSDWVLQS